MTDQTVRTNAQADLNLRQAHMSEGTISDVVHLIIHFGRDE